MKDYIDQSIRESELCAQGYTAQEIQDTLAEEDEEEEEWQRRHRPPIHNP